MSNNPFESSDRSFKKWKEKNPDGTYALYSVTNQSASIKRGNLHPTLGVRTQKYEDFWKAGLLDFQRYQKYLDIKPERKIVDYGCGSLRLGAHFIRLLEPNNYYGLDVTTDFIEMGLQAIGQELLAEKKPILNAINEATIDEATKFKADMVISTACAFQIHPNEKGKYLKDLKLIASKKGAEICFDTKISEMKFRYKPSGYVWTMDYYLELMSPFVLIDSIKIKDHIELGRSFEGCVLRFKNL